MNVYECLCDVRAAATDRIIRIQVTWLYFLHRFQCDLLCVIARARAKLFSYMCNVYFIDLNIDHYYYYRGYHYVQWICEKNLASFSMIVGHLLDAFSFGTHMMFPSSFKYISRCAPNKFIFSFVRRGVE